MNTTIQILPIRALKDNYIWAMINAEQNKVIVVDPGEAAPVFEFIKANQFTLSAILITHKHGDHCHGVNELMAAFAVPVIGPAHDAIPHLSQPVHDGETLAFDEFNLQFRVLEIPGHTLEHIAYYGCGVLFCGDTLFTGGCGRLFEGTPKQMYHSLNKLTQLPDDTLVYCGHEYTASNLKFARAVEPDNADLLTRIQKVETCVAKNIPTVPARLAEEKRTNPFLRCSVPQVIAASEQHAQQLLTGPIAVFATLRDWKNNF